MNQDSTSEMIIITSTDVINKGNNRQIAKNGTFTFKQLLLVGEPGSEHTLIITSP